MEVWRRCCHRHLGRTSRSNADPEGSRDTRPKSEGVPLKEHAIWLGHCHEGPCSAHKAEPGSELFWVSWESNRRGCLHGLQRPADVPHSLQRIHLSFQDVDNLAKKFSSRFCPLDALADLLHVHVRRAPAPSRATTSNTWPNTPTS